MVFFILNFLGNANVYKLLSLVRFVCLNENALCFTPADVETERLAQIAELVVSKAAAGVARQQNRFQAAGLTVDLRSGFRRRIGAVAAVGRLHLRAVRRVRLSGNQVDRAVVAGAKLRLCPVQNRRQVADFNVIGGFAAGVLVRVHLELDRLAVHLYGLRRGVGRVRNGRCRRCGSCGRGGPAAIYDLISLSTVYL